MTALTTPEVDDGSPWLDTGGRRQGTVFWRFLLVREQPEAIGSRVLPLVEVPFTDGEGVLP